MSDVPPAAGSEASAALAAEPAAARGLRWPLLALAVILVLGAAGGGAYFLIVPQHSSPSAKAGEARRSAPKAPAIYIKFDPPMVVNFEANGVTRYLQIGIEVMTRDAATADMVRLHEPRLRNDLLMLLGGQEYGTLSTREGKERLRQEALQSVVAVIASEGGDPAKVEQLFFSSFVMQ